MNPRDTFDTVAEMLTILLSNDDASEQVLRLVGSQESMVNALAIMTAMFRSLLETTADTFGVDPREMWAKFAVQVAANRAVVDFLPPD